jgi:hypothetical protein
MANFLKLAREWNATDRSNPRLGGATVR